MRLKSIIQGPSVKRQATSTLRCVQTLAGAQSHIRARRIRMLEENDALQRQFQQKCEKELEKFRASVSATITTSICSLPVVFSDVSVISMYVFWQTSPCHKEPV